MNEDNGSGEEKAAEEEEEEQQVDVNVGRASESGNSIVLSGNKLALSTQGRLDDIYEIIKSKMKQYEEKINRDITTSRATKSLLSNEFVAMIGLMIVSTPITKKEMNVLKSM